MKDSASAHDRLDDSRLLLRVLGLLCVAALVTLLALPGFVSPSAKQTQALGDSLVQRAGLHSLALWPAGREMRHPELMNPAVPLRQQRFPTLPNPDNARLWQGWTLP